MPTWKSGRHGNWRSNNPRLDTNPGHCAGVFSLSSSWGDATTPQSGGTPCPPPAVTPGRRVSGGPALTGFARGSGGPGGSSKALLPRGICAGHPSAQPQGLPGHIRECRILCVST